jgi:hypothetical protein
LPAIAFKVGSIFSVKLGIVIGLRFVMVLIDCTAPEAALDQSALTRPSSFMHNDVVLALIQG